MGVPPSIIDTHELGAGFGGHLFFTHNVTVGDTAHQVTGTWTVALANHLYNVYVHVPSTGGTTNFAHYKVTGADGTVYDRVVDQERDADEWLSLGYFDLNANAKVTLITLMRATHTRSAISLREAMEGIPGISQSLLCPIVTPTCDRSTSYTVMI